MAHPGNAKPTHSNVGLSAKQSGTDAAQQTALRPVVNFRGTHRIASVPHRSRGKTERCVGWQRALAGVDYVLEVRQYTRCWVREDSEVLAVMLGSSKREWYPASGTHQTRILCKAGQACLVRGAQPRAASITRAHGPIGTWFEVEDSTLRGVAMRRAVCLRCKPRRRDLDVEVGHCRVQDASGAAYR
jgi:hypothetical protein